MKRKRRKRKEKEEVTNALVPNASYDVATHTPQRERGGHKNQRIVFPHFAKKHPSAHDRDIIQTSGGECFFFNHFNLNGAYFDIIFFAQHIRCLFQNRTENILEKDDRLYFHFNQFDREISLDFHSARNDVTEYSMSLDKFISSLQTSISN